MLIHRRVRPYPTSISAIRVFKRLEALGFEIGVDRPAANIGELRTAILWRKALGMPTRVKNASVSHVSTACRGNWFEMVLQLVERGKTYEAAIVSRDRDRALLIAGCGADRDPALEVIQRDGSGNASIESQFETSASGPAPTVLASSIGCSCHVFAAPAGPPRDTRFFEERNKFIKAAQPSFFKIDVLCMSDLQWRPYAENRTGR